MKRKILSACALLAAALVVAALFTLDVGSWQELDMDKLTALKQTTVILDADDKETAYLYGSENRLRIDAEILPEYVSEAFIAIEDARFYEHHGIDVIRLGGALISNIKSMSFREGASTITQQLIKLTHLTSEKTIARKAQEMYLALKLERRATKDEILEMYLNVVYFGRGAYGIEAAARSYFGKSASVLTLDEAALLAGVIKSPTKYAPHIHPENALARRSLVLEAMAEAEYITEDEAKAADASPLNLRLASASGADWYVDTVLAEAEELLGVSSSALLAAGYRIYTSLDAAMQQRASELFADSSLFPASAGDGTPAQAALVCLDNYSGELKCVIGGREYEAKRALNRATQIKRQPGSAFKPVSVYAAALDSLGYTPASLVEDVSRDFGGGYSPKNAGGGVYGTVTLRQALSRSMNVATVDLITRTGVANAAGYARRLGITLADEDENLSLALGSLTYGVSPAELCAAYATIANGGLQVKCHAIRRIEDAGGEIIYEYAAPEERALSAESAYMLISMLQSAASEGTARELGALDFPVAAKTGTVGMKDGSNRDAWVAACCGNITAAVWMGFDNPDSAHALPPGEVGGGKPARLAARFLKDFGEGDFSMPSGLEWVLLDKSALESARAALLAGESTPESAILREVYPLGKRPTEVSHMWDQPLAVGSLSLTTNAEGLPELSFIAIEEGATYLAVRAANGLETVVGEAKGAPGEWLSLTDPAPIGACEYYVVARHDGFAALGKTVYGPPSARVAYAGQGGILDLLFPESPDETEPADAREALF